MLDYTVRPPMARSKGKRKNAFVRALIAIFPAKGDAVAEIIRKIIFIGAVTALVITGGTLLSDIRGELVQEYVISERLNKIKGVGTGNLDQDLVKEVIEKKPYIRNDFIGLYAENNDFIGWFNLGDEEKIIDNPVVQADDNDEYLYKSFDGQKIKSGTLFADFRCEFDEEGKAPNFLVLYGHCLSSQLMFSKLNRYYYERENPDANTYFTSFYKKYPTINFDTLKENGRYKIFAACLFNTDEQYGEVYNYLRYGKPFESKDDFNNYIMDIMDRSFLATDVDLTYGDDIICMSTCYFPFDNAYEHFENVRCAVFARRVREGESPEVDVSKVTRNYYWVGWQQAVDRGICSPYAGRKWDTGKLLSYEEEP